MKISVICVYNNKNAFNEQLLTSLQNQDVEYEMVAIDNTKKQFNSAAAALNRGGEKATGDILIFSHQDIYLKTSKELRLFANVISQLADGTIVGAAGAVKNIRGKTVYNLTGGDKYINKLSCEYSFSGKTSELIEVATVDEVFFGMSAKTFSLYKFNEDLCDGWHLYSVEMSLHARAESNKVYVAPIQMHHFSWGNVDMKFYKTYQKIAKSYKKSFDIIETTCINAGTSFFKRNAYIIYFSRKLKRIVRRCLPKLYKSLRRLRNIQ